MFVDISDPVPIFKKLIVLVTDRSLLDKTYEPSLKVRKIFRLPNIETKLVSGVTLL